MSFSQQDGTASFALGQQPGTSQVPNINMNQAGNLVVRPLTARITRSTSFFGKMDPLVKVIIGSHFQKTPMARKGHKNPGWETELSLRRSMNEEHILFELWDRDIASPDDLIATTYLPFSYLLSIGNKFNGWLRLGYKGKPVGELLVDIVFIPDATPESKTLPLPSSTSFVSVSKGTSMPRITIPEIDQSKILEGDPNKEVRKKSIGSPYSYPLQGATHTTYPQIIRTDVGTGTKTDNIVDMKTDKETMTTAREFPKVLHSSYVTTGTSTQTMQEPKKYSVGTDPMGSTLRGSEMHTTPGDIISGYYDKDRMDRNQKVRTVEGGYTMNDNLGEQERSLSSSYYHSREPVNRSIEKKNMNPGGMDRAGSAVYDQGV